MVKYVSFALGGALVLTMGACNGVADNSPITEKSIPISYFKAIELVARAKAEVYIVAGCTPSLVIKATTNQLNHLSANVQDSTLNISADTVTINFFERGKVPELIIKTPSLEALSLTGAVSVNSHGAISGKEFRLDVSGAGSTSLEQLSVEDFSTVISGAGNLEIKGGTTKKANYQISGTGKINAFGMQTDESIVKIAGAGKSEISAKSKLTAAISGAGYVKYKGSPVVTEDITGAGKVKAVDN